MGTRIPTGILLVAGLVLLFVRPGEWIIVVLMAAVVVIRICDLRRGTLKFAPWPLTIIALFMPRPAARSYLEELGHSVNQVWGRERGWHVWDAVKAFPGTLVTVWHCWLRAKVVTLTVRVLSRRVHQLLLTDMAVSPRRALRRLRRYCRLVLYATGRAQYRMYADSARALLRSCEQLTEHGGGVELDALVRQEAEKLACALTSRRPDRA